MKNNTVPKTNAASGKLTARPKQKAAIVPTGFRILTDADQIKNAVGKLQTKLAANATEYKVNVVSLGKTCLAYWHDKERFWSITGIGKGGRHQIRLGPDNPRRGKTVAMVVQFSIPMKGSNKRLAGVFVTDDQGRIYLAHSGNISPRLQGGGTRAFRTLFKKYGKSQHEVVGWPKGKKRWLILVTSLDDKQAVENIGHFVQEVMKLKLKVLLKQPGTTKVPTKLTPQQPVMARRKRPAAGTTQRKTSGAVGTLPPRKPAVAS